MFVSLVKIKKYLIYFFLFLFFNCIYINSLKADINHEDAESTNAEFSFSYGITFDDDGDKMYIVGFDSNDKDIVVQYDLATPYDVSTKSFEHKLREVGTANATTTILAAIGTSRIHDIRFNDDGSRMYLSMLNEGIKTFQLSTPYQISSASFLNTRDPSDSGNFLAIEFDTTGRKLFIEDNNEIDEYDVETAFDLSSTLTYVDSLSLEGSAASSLAFSSDGTTLFVLDRVDQKIYEYSLTTGFDISSATLVDDYSVADEEVQPEGIAFNDDGSKVFITGTDGDKGGGNDDEVNEYTLNNAAYNLAVPTLSSSSPSDDATNVALDANIVLTFSERMDVEEGNITIKKTSGSTTVETINVTSSQVTGTGTTTITINPSSDLEQNTEYYVLIDATAFDDGSDASYAGITSTTALSFTAANSAPTLVSSVPADDATDVAIDANIILNFSESVNADDGDIVIYKTSGGTTVETIASTTSNVTGSGTSQITINPSADFEYGIEYYILIDSGAFDDANDEDYTGITSTTALSFTVNNRVDPTTIKDVVGSIDAQSESAKNYIIQSIDTVSNRLRYLRQNRLSHSLSSLNLQIDAGNTILTSLANDNLQKNTNSIMSDNWSLWSSGTISVAKIGDSINSSSQETEGQGVALGFDKKLSDSDFLGFAIQYGQSDTDIGTNGTSIDTENMNFSIYRTRPLDDNNFIETFLGVGFIESDLKRVHNSNILTGSRDGTQIFGSINFGKTIDRGDFNLTPIGRLDLGLTELDGYTETGTDALSYAKQRIENGLASFGFEFSDNFKLNENKLIPFGSLTFITNFSNSSDAKMNYVADTSTIYTYTHKANSDHLLSSMIGLKYIAGDYLNINSSYRRVQGNKSEQRDTIDFDINFISNRETQYSLSLAGDENTEAKLGISKNIHGFNLGFNASESFSANPNQEAELMLTYNF